VDCTQDPAGCYHSPSGPADATPPPSGKDKLSSTTIALIVAAGVIGLLLMGFCCCCGGSRPAEERSVMRESILGLGMMPDTQLAKKDVGPRWMVAQRPSVSSGERLTIGSADDEAATGFTVQQHGGVPHSTRSSPSKSRSTASSLGSVVRATESRRMRKGAGDDEIAVMFTDSHVRELRPRNWRQRPLGKGSFGTVYRAQWRGRWVAVKEIILPTEPETASLAARQELKKRCAVIAKDFVTEVEVCCDLNHPNLVRLMGYATNPRLIIVQVRIYSACS
jgi:hypothetical protein